MPLDQQQIENLKRLDEVILTEDFDGYEPIDAPFDKILKQNKRRILRKDYELLTEGPEEGADRSNLIFALGGRLLERGVPFDHAFVLLQGSELNKFQGRGDEVQRIYEGLKKVEKKAKVRKLHAVDEEDEVGKASSTLPWQDDSNFRLERFKPPTWLVEGIWTERGRGFIAAEPKASKSTLGLDLAISVATGEPFLGHFHVRKTGRVLFIQEEMDKAEVQMRRLEILKSKGISGDFKIHKHDDGLISVETGSSVNIDWLNRSQFKLTLQDHLDALEAKIKTERPLMLVLDPLQRMFDGNLRNEQEVTPVLEWLDYINDRYHCAIVIIHHFNKPKEGGPGADDHNRMLGTQALTAWYENLLILTRKNQDVRVVRKFRSKDELPFAVRIDWGDEEDPMYEVEVAGAGKKTDNLLDLVIAHPGISLTQAAEQLNVSKPFISKKAKRLGLVVKKVKPPKGTTGGRPTAGLFPPKNKW